MPNPMWSEAQEELAAATAAYSAAHDELASLRAQKPAEEGAKMEQWQRLLAKAQDDVKKARAAFRAASNALLQMHEDTSPDLHMQGPW